MCPCSIWDSTATPAVPSANDPQGVELGVRFRSDSAGYIKGIRFYKGASNVGPHTGKLWTATGTLLASATFSAETASGWQEVRFATPVAIAANTVYVASYYTASGYAYTVPYFTSQIYHPPLTALADGDGGGNGVYQYGAGGFPTSTYSAANYWVDVVFDSTAASSSGPTLTSLSPSSAPAGGAGFTLTVTGSNFVSGASVRWNGSARTTTFVSASQLTAAIAPADISTMGMAQVSVANPDGSLSHALSFTTTSACPCSIWDSTATPAVASANDPQGVELGVRFRSDSAGYIKGIRFYKGASNVGPHTGKLWTATGTLLASATFSAETASGWQEVRFATPVAIAANTVYVASYYTASGYAYTVPYFTSQIYHPPLTALADGDGGGNGVYQYGAGGFPTSTYSAANYWVDVVFDSTAGSAPGPTLASLSPSSAPAGGAGFTLTVTGSNFVSGASVRWNGSARTTTFVSASQLTATIGSADIAAAGTAQVTVANPDGSVSNALSFTITAPGPTLASLSPSSAPAGGAGFTLTVTGSNFVSGASVRWNGSARTTTFVSASQLTATIGSADIAAAGTAQVTVANPDGSVSNALSFTITAPGPTLASLSPSSAPAGGAGFTLTVTGSNFVSGASVRWNGSARTTTFVSASQLTATIGSADIAAAGTAQVTVANPDGSVSNALSFTITAPGPTLASLSPSSAPAGGAGFTLTVTGSNFVSGASVRWNGSARTTTFVSASQLTATIGSADIAAAGTAQVTVANPDGSVSNALSFTITAPGPTLASLSPSSAPAGGAGFTLTVTGSNFVSGASVRWNGSARTTTFVSASQLTATIGSADIAAAGTAQVTVANPNGSVSNGLPFTITAASYALTVTKQGPGAVTSTPGGINCGSDCSESYAPGTVVMLTATPNKNRVFQGWGGACTGTATTCSVTMNATKTVTATFSNK